MVIAFYAKAFPGLPWGRFWRRIFRSLCVVMHGRVDPDYLEQYVRCEVDPVDPHDDPSESGFFHTLEMGDADTRYVPGHGTIIGREELAATERRGGRAVGFAATRGVLASVLLVRVTS